ncbi:MAG: prephenate dehydratase [Dethiobacteria bacterium]|jgi:prephenate dehydratase
MTESIAYLGPAGTFTEEAARQFNSEEKYFLKSFPSLEKVMAAVERNETTLGIVPVENSLEGSVNLTFDLLAQDRKIKIKGELLLRICHTLLAHPGQDLAEIKEVYSHPQALAQCRCFLEKALPDAIIHNMASTAEAAALVACSKGKAVLASRRVAQIYGLQALVENVQDDNNNITRFLILALQDSPPTGNDKTSLLLGLNDQPGSLFLALSVFAGNNVNLTKIESRPIRGEPGKYIFFLDIEGHRDDPVIADALCKVEKKALFLKVFGSYPKGILPP